MALRLRKAGLIAGVAAVGLAALLGWAWADGGEQPLRPVSGPVTIPGASR